MRNNFIDILANKVEIPMIQRDYAQGRRDNKTNKIRSEFLDALFEVIDGITKDSTNEIDLDFIYGYADDENGNSEFTPIDGQQRLTTLWLLYWLVGAVEKIDGAEKAFLKNFKYEIRHSTSQFFSRLVDFVPEESASSISSQIKNQHWYFETWDFDPTIQAMLVVLDDIEKRYNKLQRNNLWSILKIGGGPFFFYKLDLAKVGLTDDLYIKMNSRGKALTEFEYFKARFSDIINDPKLKSRFDKSVDGKWADTLWQKVFESDKNEEEDVAIAVDNAFLNFFNFITNVIFLKETRVTGDKRKYVNTEETPEILTEIYSDSSNIEYLLSILDAICNISEEVPEFWQSTFYYDKEDFESEKVRLYFAGEDANLLNVCLFHYADGRGLSYPEQLLLLACLIHFKAPVDDFQNRIRILRNLTVNSSNELRPETIGRAFAEVEEYVFSGDLSVFKTFKSSQIQEEKDKQGFLKIQPDCKAVMTQLEDSDVFRGSISLIPFKDNFKSRAFKFLEIFDEDDFIEHFDNKSNLLLCFGDYSQIDGNAGHRNLMAPDSNIIRRFLTLPAYDKEHFYKMTQTAVLDCLDYFIENPNINPRHKIQQTLEQFNKKEKDWVHGRFFQTS